MEIFVPSLIDSAWSRAGFAVKRAGCARLIIPRRWAREQFGAVRGLRNGNDLAVSLWQRFQGPIFFRLFRSNELTVVSENHIGIRVTHFKRQRGGVFEMRQVITGERMAQSVIRRLFYL